MSKTVDEIKEPVARHMEVFEEKFKDAMKSSVPLLDKITTYIVKRKGKQIRPMFVFLSAQASGEVNDSTHRAAALIELLHTATLVHDDVVDDSNERRGFFSVNALWKNKIAVRFRIRFNFPVAQNLQERLQPTCDEMQAVILFSCGINTLSTT